MDLFGFTHISMPIMGAIVFVLGTALVGLIKEIETGPTPSRWLRHDISILIVGTALALPTSIGLGLMTAGVIGFLAGHGGSLVELLLMVAIVVVGWQLTMRREIGLRPGHA